MTRNAHSQAETARDRCRAALDTVANAAIRAGSAAKDAATTARDRTETAFSESVRAHRSPTGHSPLKHRANLAILATAAGVGVTGLFHVLAAAFQVLSTVLRIFAPLFAEIASVSAYGVVGLFAVAVALWVADTAAAVRAADA